MSPRQIWSHVLQLDHLLIREYSMATYLSYMFYFYNNVPLLVGHRVSWIQCKDIVSQKYNSRYNKITVRLTIKQFIFGFQHSSKPHKMRVEPTQYHLVTSNVILFLYKCRLVGGREMVLSASLLNSTYHPCAFNHSRYPLTLRNSF